MENRLFYYSLFISFLIHVIFAGYLTFTRKNIFQRPQKQIEVSYMVLDSDKVIKKSLPKKESNFVKEREQAPKVDILTKKQGDLPFLDKVKKDFSDLAGKFKLEKKQAPKIMTEGAHKKVSIPLFKSEKITNKEYTGYELRLQNKIKKIVENYTDRDDFEPGHVYLTFLIASSGLLKEVKIIEEKTDADEYLRDIALRSIKSANPFPPFPEDMKYPELSYNILITFDVK